MTCPTPAKKAYKTNGAAKKHLWTLLYRSRQPARTWLHTYKCPCGKWHVGHVRGKATA